MDRDLALLFFPHEIDAIILVSVSIGVVEVIVINVESAKTLAVWALLPTSVSSGPAGMLSVRVFSMERL